jgi:hypothetical protein
MRLPLTMPAPITTRNRRDAMSCGRSVVQAQCRAGAVSCGQKVVRGQWPPTSRPRFAGREIALPLRCWKKANSPSPEGFGREADQGWGEGLVSTSLRPTPPPGQSHLAGGRQKYRDIMQRRCRMRLANLSLRQMRHKDRRENRPGSVRTPQTWRLHNNLLCTAPNPSRILAAVHEVARDLLDAGAGNHDGPAASRVPLKETGGRW